MKLNFIVLIVLFGIFSPKTKAQTDYYLKTSGNMHLLASWTTDATGLTSSLTPTSFTTSNCIWHFTNRTVLQSLTSAIAFGTAASTVVIEDGFLLSFQSNGKFTGTAISATVKAATVSIAISTNPLPTNTKFNTSSMVKIQSGTSIWSFSTPYYDLMINNSSQNAQGIDFSLGSQTQFSVSNNFYIGDGIYVGDVTVLGIIYTYVYNASYTSVKNFSVGGNLYLHADDIRINNFTVTGNVYIGNGIAETVSNTGPGGIPAGYFNGNNTSLGVYPTSNGSTNYIGGNVIDLSNSYTVTNSTNQTDPTSTYSNITGGAGTFSLSGPRHSIESCTITNATDKSSISSTYSNVIISGALALSGSTHSITSCTINNATDQSTISSTYSNVTSAGTFSLTGPIHSIVSCTINNTIDQSSTSSTYSNVTFSNNLYLQGTGTYSVLTNMVVGGTFSLSATNGFSLDPTNTTPITFSANSCVLNTNLILEAGTATISGALSGTGSITADSNASLVLDQNSSGTLKMSSPFQLKNFTMANNSNITLGTNLSIVGAGQFNLLGGILSLNSKTLSIEGTSSASLTASGFISDSGTSTFSFATTTNMTGTGLMMTPGNNILKALVTNTNLTLSNALSIKDYIQINGGTFTTNNFLTLEADATKAARVAQSAGVISGSVTVETYIPGGSAGWSLLGSGGLSGVTINDWDDDFYLSCLNCTVPSSTAVNGSFFASIQSYSEPSSALFTSIYKTDVITPGKGFWVYIGINTYSASPFIISNTYTLNQGSITYPVTNSGDGYNLIANPYASPIDFDLFRAHNSSLIKTQMYGHNRTASGSYVAGGVGVGGVSVTIPAGQAFYVVALSAGTVTFTEAMKTTSNSVLVLRSSSLAHSLKLKIKASDNNSDETIISSSSNGSLDYDTDYDCKKVNLAPSYFGVSNNKFTSISTKIGNNVFSINDIGVITNTIAIPLQAKSSMPGQYTISAEDALNYEGCAIIKDKLLNVYNDLMINPYVFNLIDTNSSNRFELILCPFKEPVSVKELNESNNILISQDENGAFVKTFFEQNTKTVISVYNILGQKMARDIILNEASAITRLEINNHNQILFIKVVANNQSVTKKIVTH